MKEKLEKLRAALTHTAAEMASEMEQAEPELALQLEGGAAAFLLCSLKLREILEADQ